MLFKFLGAAQEVGRSAILLKLDKTLLLDYGIKLDKKIEIPLAEPNIDALLLSHAHLDHSGFIPRLYKHQSFPTFSTFPTFKLSELLLKDSINIAKKDHSILYFNKRDLRNFKINEVPKNYESEFNFGESKITFYDAGHVCGSSITRIENNNKQIVYTGDFKLTKQKLHDGAKIIKSNVLITESTYATKQHPNREQLIKQFIEKIKNVLDNGGNALLPAFAVGRGQELLAILHEHNLTPITYVSGMIKKASAIALNNQKYISNSRSLERAFEEVEFVKGRIEQKQALKQPSIILTTAGMLNGGPVLNYISKLNKNSHIFLTGYQVNGTNGRMLLDSGFIIDNNEKIKINTSYSFYDFSAHADKKDLFEYVNKSSPETVICIHGDKENAISLANELKEQGFDARAPQLNEIIKI